MPFFNLQHSDKNTHARAGIIHTDHGDIETPMFMPVGTQASVKTLDQTDLNTLGAAVILGNTYHLHLRPGEDLIADQGGLHKFMNWNKPILTDSGGFQVFSLGEYKNKKTLKHQNTRITEQCNNEPDLAAELRGIWAGFLDKESAPPTIKHDCPLTPQQAAGYSRATNKTGDETSQGRLVKIDEDGVTFRSYIDGSTHRFTPESAIEIQHKLGADIIMAFDECTPDTAPEIYVREAMERTHQWAKRCLKYHKNTKALKHRQFLFGIIQGAGYKHLREESARFISSLDFDGIAIGGESIGYNMEATAQILDWVSPIIPKDKPHYAMGIGLSPADLLVAVAHGVDMFDCVGPTRLARHGMLFIKDKTNNHRLNIKNAKHETDTGPVDKTCGCSTCESYSRSYLHHLFNAGEISGLRLATIHNLHFLLNLMRETRQTILNDRFKELMQEWV